MSGEQFVATVNQSWWSVNSDTYVSISWKGLFQIFSSGELIKGDSLIMEDMTPYHMAKMFRDWLDENTIKMFPWSSQPPDMNPLGELWDIMDKRIHKKKKTREGLKNQTI